MIIDSSAIVAILFQEPEAEAFMRVIDQSAETLISAPTLLEAALVVQSRRGTQGEYQLDFFIKESDIKIVPFTEEQSEIARHAFRKYGKGHHPAKLNFGDCIAYALAKDTGEPLLFKGTDFAKTDIVPVAFDT